MRAHPAGPRHGEVLPAASTPVQAHAPIAPPVWSVHARRGQSGALEIGGVDCRDLVAEFGSPLYVLDEEDARARAREFGAAYAAAGAARVYYAAKALAATAVLRWMAEEGLGVDAASGGELEVALRAGVPAEAILLHGNNKSVPEIERAVAAGVGRIVVDSFEDVVRIAAAADRLGAVQPVLVRVTVGVEAHTHEYIATAHEDQKFGLPMAPGGADEAVRRILKLPALEFAGLHSHIGSQIFDASGFQVAAARVIALAKRLSEEQQAPVAEINLGGGMGIAYTAADDPLAIGEMAATIGAIVAAECAAADLPVPALAFEPGRAIIGPAGVTLYEVGTIKAVPLDSGASRTYVSVDGGMSDNIRTALYGAEYTVALASRSSEAEAMLVRVAGKHCESGDIVVRDAWLPADLAPGDLIAVAATGAYCRAMASNYNLLPRPAVVSVRSGRASVVLRGESIADVLALDPGA